MRGSGLALSGDTQMALQRKVIPLVLLNEEEIFQRGSSPEVDWRTMRPESRGET